MSRAAFNLVDTMKAGRSGTLREEPAQGRLALLGVRHRRANIRNGQTVGYPMRRVPSRKKIEELSAVYKSESCRREYLMTLFADCPRLRAERFEAGTC
jgi:hypothetical protein